MKYYIYECTYREGRGEFFILANDETCAMKRLRQIMNERHPFRRYTARLKQVMPA